MFNCLLTFSPQTSTCHTCGRCVPAQSTYNHSKQQHPTVYSSLKMHHFLSFVGNVPDTHTESEVSWSVGSGLSSRCFMDTCQFKVPLTVYLLSFSFVIDAQRSPLWNGTSPGDREKYLNVGDDGEFWYICLILAHNNTIVKSCSFDSSHCGLGLRSPTIVSFTMECLSTG